MFVFTRGIARGIEIVAKYCVPMLLVIGVILAVRVLTLPPVEGRSISDGLAQIWSVKNWVGTHPSQCMDCCFWPNLFYTERLAWA